jgi:hypothetical protein
MFERLFFIHGTREAKTQDIAVNRNGSQVFNTAEGVEKASLERCVFVEISFSCFFLTT